MFLSHITWYFPKLNTAIDHGFQQDEGGLLSQLDFYSVLILIGIVVLLLAIIGPSIRRIAVVEFIEPPKEGMAQKSRGIFGLREQIILGSLGLSLLGFGVTMEIKSSIPKVLPTCKDAPSISIMKIANTCGCNVSDFDEIKVNTNVFLIVGEWFNENWSLFDKDRLWALLIDENTDKVLDAKAVGMNPPRWHTSFSLGNEIGKIYKVRLWVLNKNTSKILEEEIKNKKDFTMPEAKDNPYYQDILLERVDPDPTKPNETCSIPKRED